MGNLKGAVTVYDSSFTAEDEIYIVSLIKIQKKMKSREQNAERDHNHTTSSRTNRSEQVMLNRHGGRERTSATNQSQRHASSCALALLITGLFSRGNVR